MPRLGSGIPLIARSAEIAALTTAFERAETGAPVAVLVSGDAGVGKSRLLSEFADIATGRGAHVLLGRCLGVGEAGLPYLPFTEIVEQIRSAWPDVLGSHPALYRLAGSAAAPESPAAAPPHEFGQMQLFDALLGALTDLAADRTLVLEIEDLHWADASTRDLLSFLLSRLNTQRLLVVATYRSDDLHRQHPFRPLLAELVRLPVVERLDLAPFDPADTRRFVRALSDDHLDPDVIDDIAARSDGNAFFAEELLAAGSVSGAGLPTALADVLMSRVEQLGPSTQRVLGAVSVSGRRVVTHTTLRAVLAIDDDVLDSSLREALQHHLIVPGRDEPDSYTFRHALMREAVYADLLPGERVRLHAAYARLITEHDPVEGLAAALAYHALNSRDLPTALAASVHAAAEARNVGAPGAALRHLERALELWSAVPEPEAVSGVDEFRLTREATWTASAAGHPERALAYARAAVPLADKQDDPVVAADVRRELAEVLLPNGRWSEAEDTIREAWSLVADCPPSRTRSWVLAILARAVDVDERRAFAEAAIKDARAIGEVSAEADALISLAFSDVRAGRIDDACALLTEARERAVVAGALEVELRALYNLVVTRHEQGRLDTAAGVVDDGIRRASEVGLTWSTYGLELRWMGTMVHFARGDWLRAAELCAPPGEQVSDTISALLASASTFVQVGQGRFDEAARDLEQLRAEWYRDSQIAHLAGVAGAEMALWQERPDLAAAVVDDALTEMRKSSSNGWPLGGIRLSTLALSGHADHARLARQRHDVPATDAAVAAGEKCASFAYETARRGRPRAAELGPEGVAWLARTRAEQRRLHGEPDVGAWRAMVDAFDYGEVYQQAIGRWRLAEALVATDQRDDAVAELSAAIEVADRLGARPLAAAARQLGQRARLPLPGVAASTADLLTPRELAVLRVVAKGLTNRQVGEELFISDKTVSVHVSRIMAKLGVSGRTEAVAVAYQRGLLTD